MEPRARLDNVERRKSCFYRDSNSDPLGRPARSQLLYQLYQSANVKINLFLCLINEAPRNEDVWGSEIIATPLSTSTLDGGKWLASHSGRFTLIG
jgi:hypothetical protein